jgi:dCMP deaminase
MGLSSIPFIIRKPEPKTMSVESASRPSFEEVYMNFAEAISKRSTCKRLQVGTVITTTDFRKVLAIGYNGNATGLDNGCDREEPGNCGCLHSEENAVINCDSPRQVEKFVFVTHLPCVMCAKRIINLGHVQRVVYAEEYRKRDAVALLHGAGIEVMRLQGAKLEPAVD